MTPDILFKLRGSHRARSTVLIRGEPLPHAFYNVVHVVGIIMLMAALGGGAVRAMPPGAAAPSTRRLLAALHGTGLFLILLGGFGMLARLEIMHGGGFPAWLWVKLIIWGVLAFALLLPRRWPRLALPVLVALPILGGVAATMAIYKPF